MESESIKESAEKNFEKGLYCAESVVLSIAEAHGIKSEMLPRMATAFCSGMSRTCGTCGALTGAVMGVSAVLGRNDVNESVEEAYRVAALVVAKFESEFGSRNCHELLGCDLGTPEGKNAFRKNRLHERCRRYTSKAAELAEEVLSGFDKMEITPVTDVAEVVSLLRECDLPADDIGSSRQVDCYGIKEESSLIGLVGLEVMGSVALLRSLAVSRGRRGNSLGRELVKFAESRAASSGVGRLYLLTATAHGYFEKLGYKVISRELAPEQIRQTGQFSGICPSSAALMVKNIRG